MAKSFEKIQKQMDDVYKITQDTALAVGIYTDHDFSEDDNILAEEFLTKFGEIGQIGFDINLISSVYDGANELKQNEYDKRIDALVKSMKPKILELEEISKQVRDKNKAVTKILRSELKKYDS